MKAKILNIVLLVCLLIPTMPVMAAEIQEEPVSVVEEQEVATESVADNLQLPEDEILTSSFVSLDAATFPDAVFRQYLADEYDTDNDGQIIDSLVFSIEIDGAENPQYANLESLEGIHKFPYLYRLIVNDTKLKSVNLASNKQLDYVDLSNNMLTSWDKTYTGFPLTICDGNCYEVGAAELDLNTLPHFDYTRTSNWQNAIISQNIVRAKDASKPVTYYYKVDSNGLVKEFALLFQEPAAQLVKINESNFPDAEFRTYLRTLGGGSAVLDANKITYLEIPGDAENLKGIELFPYLTSIRLDRTKVKELDLSRHKFIQYVTCISNFKLQKINVKNCPELLELFCPNNVLTELDVTQNPKLEWLDCNNNYLTYLDVSNNLRMDHFRCHENYLTSLHIDNNSLLRVNNINLFNCTENKLTYNGKQLALSGLKGFDISRVENWQNATVQGGILKPVDMSASVTYVYNIGRGKVQTFKIEFTGEDNVNPDWPFADVAVNPGNWKYEAVKYVYDNKIMNGVGDGTRFDPDAPLTREMFATVLYRMAGEPAVTFKNKYPDVPAGKWYSKAVIWASEQGIVSGYGSGNFGTGHYITREQIAKMLMEYGKKQGYDVSQRANFSTFADAGKVSGWANDYMKWAVGSGMIGGSQKDGKYYLNPKGNATRAESATMLKRFDEKY